MDARVLALETSTEACSAALACGGQIRERYELAPRRHAQLILAMIDGLMAEAGLTAGQLDAVAFGRGPGAFTGVRIAVGVVQGIALAADLPVVPVSTLAALAQGAMDERGVAAVIAAIDARMDEVYAGAYRRDATGLARLTGEEQVAVPQSIWVPDGGPWHGAGSGWARYGAELEARCGGRLSDADPQRLPTARAVLRLGLHGWQAGQGVDAARALPVYLRDQVVQP